MAPVTFTTLASLVAGNPENISDVTDCLTKLQTGTNAIDKEQATNALAQLLGLNNGVNVGRGKSIIATTEARSNVAYGTLTTPDQVTGLVLPTDGLIFVAYQATWQQSNASAARAAIFIGATQLKNDAGGASPAVQEAIFGATTASDFSLATANTGLFTGATSGWTGDVTTGQVVGANTSGGVCGPIFAAAGTYTVSVQFKASAGSVTAKNRKLWVWSIGF